MAYFIFDNNNSLVGICSNDTEKNAQNNLENLTVKSVDQTNYEGVLFGTQSVSLVDGNLQYTSLVVGTQPNVPAGKTISDDTYPTQSDLEAYLDRIVKPACKEFVDNGTGNSMHSGVQAYYNYLVNLDLSTLSFPMSNTWEKYCSDNSITYYHPLQIP